MTAEKAPEELTEDSDEELNAALEIFLKDITAKLLDYMTKSLEATAQANQQLESMNLMLDEFQAKIAGSQKRLETVEGETKPKRSQLRGYQ